MITGFKQTNKKKRRKKKLGSISKLLRSGNTHIILP